MSDTEAAKIAAGLTEAMREGLLRRPCRSWWGDSPACMPHRVTTGDALAKRGLCLSRIRRFGRARPLTPLGQRVRAYLTSQEQDNA